MQARVEDYLLDTSAMFAFTDNEDGAETVQRLLEAGQNEQVSLFISTMSLMEIYYITHQELGEEEARQMLALVQSLPVKGLALNEDLLMTAGDLKARFRISVADAWIAATAKMQALTLVHKDPEFEPLKDELAMMELPFKFSRKRR